jgi:hypothetical protein
MLIPASPIQLTAAGPLLQSSVPGGTWAPSDHNHIFVLSKTLAWSEMGPPLRQEEEPDYYWSLPLYWGLSSYH